MKEVQELHRKAMELAEEAFFTRKEGSIEKAKALFREALKFESEAAALLENRLEMEPTRSVLFRSAATLALDCGEPWLAEQLIARGLAGNPPEEIAGELRELNERLELLRKIRNEGYSYELSEGDMRRLQRLIDEMREAINSVKELDHNRRERILDKLEDIQNEL